jgi:HlyD family secretion protein
LEGATLVAPFDGIIGEVNGQVGQINGINASSATLLTIMSEELQLSALVNEADIGRIKVGQDVEFTSSTFADKTFTGQVLRITPQATTVSNVQYYPVLISCNDPDGVLMSGMTVSANIIVARRTDVLAVPMMAVSYAESNTRSNPGSASGKSAGVKSKTTGGSAAVTESVVLVMENNQAVIKSVVLGINDGSNYEVIQGLNEGDKVIVGSNQADAATSGSGSSSGSSKNTTRQNQGGPGMGGPPPGM